MKKLTTIMSLLSGLIAVLAVILNFQVIFGRGMFVGFAMFSMMRSGGFLGYIGNLLGVLTTAAAFAAMCWYGLNVTIRHKDTARRPALVSGIAVTIIALISLICSVAGHSFNFGDILILLFPVAFTFCIIQTTDA